MSALVRFDNKVIPKTTQAFTTTGSVQTFTVPAGVYWIRFFLWGAGGVGQNSGINVNSAGGGAFVEGNLQTTPGTVYSIVVGARGRYYTAPTIALGGASGGGTGADGGGFSGIFSSTPGVNTVIAIAGGGGGAGFNGNGYGGGGGYPSGGTAQGSSPGGSQTAGGGGSFPGSQFLGGVAGFGGDCCGGGGGGGWYGGGGGNGQQGGGGGSSTFKSMVFNPVLENGTNGSPTGVAPTPPGGTKSPVWISPLGSAGQTGLVVIAYNPSVLPMYIISSASIAPTGGTITVVGARTFHTFTSNGTFFLPAGKLVEIFAIGGGGGGGYYVAGGGGAGGLQNPTLSVAAGSYAITIGQGGNGGIISPATAGQVGGNTTVGSIVTAYGGGYGGSYSASSSGGCGGGGGSSAGTQGYAGGGSRGGGGGVGGPGADGYWNAGTWTGGAGGIGVTYYGRQYGGGGGGGGQFSSSGIGTYGGGNGAGSGNDSGDTGSPGLANTGGGGGGGWNGGKGGSGIVIISYASIPKFAASLNPGPMQITLGSSSTRAIGGTRTIYGSYYVHTFTTVGTSTFVVTPPNALTVKALIVAGGGGGAQPDAGGGGGGGGAVYQRAILLTPGTYTVTVGAGGAQYSAGGNSSLLSYVGFGGGAGGAGNGGCGGGGSGEQGGGTGSQGFNGSYGNSQYTGGGGGGGMGAPGTTFRDLWVYGYGHFGGDGMQSAITGTPTYYAGGGGGATGGLGGKGGGGRGYTSGTATPGTNGLGGGGGGGAAGGSGTVIISYIMNGVTAVPFSPSSITGLTLWYDAADTTTLTISNGNVTQWRDKASSIVLSGATAPYVTSGSYPLVRFSGSITFTSTTNLPYSSVCTSAANFTCFIVQNTSSSTGVNGLPLTVFLSGNVSRFAPFTNADGSIFFDGASQGSPRLGGITQITNTAQLLTFSRTNITTMYGNVNGTLKSTNVFTNPSNFVNGSYTIYMSQGGATWKGDMYEVLYFNTDLTAAQVQQIEGYLAWKWGLQTSLPATHAYKYDSPY